MRIAIVADIHGNRTALDAVLADLHAASPDVIFHGGDLAHGGASPADVVDRVQDLGWPGVLGNTDEMYFRPESLTDYAAETSKAHPTLKPMFDAIAEMSAAARESLGTARLDYLRGLPLMQLNDCMALVHASPASLWRAPAPDATDAELETCYGPLDKPVVVYCHIHRPYVRHLPTRIVCNTGSVGLPFDGDRRASYLLIDDGVPAIWRVEYDVNRELRALAESKAPHTDWICRTLAAASPQPINVDAQ